MRRRYKLGLATAAIVAVVAGLAAFRSADPPPAESELSRHFAAQSIPAETVHCAHLEYDSDPTFYTCTLDIDLSVRIPGHVLRPGRPEFCLSIPRSASSARRDSDPVPLAPNEGVECITRALGGES